MAKPPSFDWNNHVDANMDIEQLLASDEMYARAEPIGFDDPDEVFRRVSAMNTGDQWEDSSQDESGTVESYPGLDGILTKGKRKARTPRAVLNEKFFYSEDVKPDQSQETTYLDEFDAVEKPVAKRFKNNKESDVAIAYKRERRHTMRLIADQLQLRMGQKRDDIVLRALVREVLKRKGINARSVGHGEIMNDAALQKMSWKERVAMMYGILFRIYNLSPKRNQVNRLTVLQKALNDISS